MNFNIAWIALSLLPHLGSARLKALLADFGTAERILAASESDLREVSGIGPVIAKAIRSIDLDVVQRKIDRWMQAGVTIIVRDEPAYPPHLRRLDDAPPTLFVRGAWMDVLRREAVAIIGTRTPTDDARQIAMRLGAELAQQGVVIVSGLALGIDSAAHAGALSAGNTVAVLGSGVLNVYPPEQAGLAQSIMGRGALVCEVAPDATVSTPGLVARNRIITGLCDKVIIVETSIDGGAMHAARFARTQGRTLYAVDLPASGNQQLIKDGAIPLSPDVSDFRLD